MFITEVSQDNISQWLVLAEEMEPIFQGSMVKNEKFHAYMDGKIKKREAFMALDRTQDHALVGIIGFSRTHNRITWFGVFEKYRNQGIGSKLLECALHQLDRTQEITVDTFREDYELGQPARHVYQKFGFVEVDNTIYDDQGNPRCVMKRFPDKTIKIHAMKQELGK